MKPQSLFDSVYIALMEDIHEQMGPLSKKELDDIAFSNSNLYLSSDNPRHIAILAMLKSLPKKYLGGDSRLFPGLSRRDRSVMALQSWRDMNNLCQSSSKKITGRELTCSTKSIVEEASCLLHDWFGGNTGSSFPLWGLIYLFQHGPGSATGVPSEDFFTKTADGPISYTTEDIRLLYKKLVEVDRLWHETERVRFQNHNSADSAIVPVLRTVPKTNVIDRTIEIGGSLNVGFQLAIGTLITSVLRVSVGIDLVNQQDRNRELARRGSLERADHGNRWCTLDLKSASDSLSVGLIEHLFKWLPDWLGAMKTFRTTHVSLDGEHVECHMFSSMGNGFTFPLQTIVFAALVVACYNHMGISPFSRSVRKFSENAVEGTSTVVERVRPNFAVFGDDIIVDERVYDLLVDTLCDVGCIVNLDKSFNNGPFRESCGTDWYHGYNVRPVYLSSLESIQDRISFINRLNRWSAMHSVPLRRTIAALLLSIPYKSRYVVPNYEGDDAGIHVGCELAEELRVRRIIPQLAVNKTLRLRLGIVHGSHVYRVYDPIRSSQTFWVRCLRNGVLETIGSTRCLRNEAGVLLTSLQGSIRSGVLFSRVRKVRYKSTWSSSPGWGDPSVLGGRSVHWAGSYSHWEVCVAANLLPSSSHDGLHDGVK